MRKRTVYVRSRRTDHTNIIFLLEYCSVYSHSWIQRVFYNWCSHVLEKFARISGVLCIRASDAPNSLFLEKNYLLTASWIIIKHYFFCYLNSSNIKIHPASLFNYLFNMYFIIYLLSHSRSRWVSHLESKSAHTKVLAPLTEINGRLRSQKAFQNPEYF